MLVIVPDEAGDCPMPNEILLADVKRYIADRSLLSLADRLDVIGPRYIKFETDITLVAKAEVEEKQLQQRVNVQLRNFLSPLKGGHDRGGWQFGQRISLSEIMRIVRQTEGVDRILAAGLRYEDDRVTEIPMPAIGLPNPALINIKIEGR